MATASTNPVVAAEGVVVESEVVRSPAARKALAVLRIGFSAGSTMPSWPTRMRFVCMATKRSRRIGLFESSNPSTWK